MSHVCPAANRIGEPTVFCPTSGRCPACGGLVCPVHGCQLGCQINPKYTPVKEASHA